MITDAEFWMEVRRKSGGGDSLFKGMLAALHMRQMHLDAHTTSLEREEYKLQSLGTERRDAVDGKVLCGDDRRKIDDQRRKREKELREMESNVETNKTLQLKNNPSYRVATISIRVLQQIMLFSVPIYSLRYNVPAMSMSWNTSCFIDRPNKQLITFGAGQGVKVPQHLCGRGCVAGDGFFAILTDHDEVWASGGLKVSSASINGPTPLGREEVMTGVAGKTLMLVGHGQRLASVTRAFTVRPLSALSNPTRSIIPSRHVRFIDLGFGEDYYMVGTDSIVYKTTASKRAVSTPRRVMTLCRTPVSRIASGTSFLLIIDQNGHLYSLGRNKKGQLGNGERQDARRKPYFHDRLTHHYFVQVSAGDCHSLALTSNGIVYGAGSNESGQLGLGSHQKEVLQFTPIPLPSKCVGIAAGPAGSMFACEDGQVLTCGLNDCMQLGLDTPQKIVYEPTPVAVLPAGVESYTMDFGGYRRPEGSPSPQEEPSPVNNNNNNNNNSVAKPARVTEEDNSANHNTNLNSKNNTNSTIGNNNNTNSNNNNNNHNVNESNTNGGDKPERAGGKVDKQNPDPPKPLPNAGTKDKAGETDSGLGATLSMTREATLVTVETPDHTAHEPLEDSHPGATKEKKPASKAPKDTKTKKDANAAKKDKKNTVNGDAKKKQEKKDGAKCCSTM